MKELLKKLILSLYVITNLVRFWNFIKLKFNFSYYLLGKM